MQLSREDVAWAAGFFDGEGNVRNSAKASGSKFVMFGLGLDQNDPELLYRFRDIFGCGAVRARNGRKCHQYTITKFEDAQFVAACMWPWLSVRRKEQISSALVAVADFKRRPVDGDRRVDSRGRLKHMPDCKNGHSYDEYGVKDSRGHWKCLECVRIRKERSK